MIMYMRIIFRAVYVHIFKKHTSTSLVRYLGMVAPSGTPTIISSRGSHSFHEFTGQLDAFILSVNLGAVVERKFNLYDNY